MDGSACSDDIGEALHIKYVENETMRTSSLRKNTADCVTLEVAAASLNCETNVAAEDDGNVSDGLIADIPKKPPVPNEKDGSIDAQEIEVRKDVCHSEPSDAKPSDFLRESATLPCSVEEDKIGDLTVDHSLTLPTSVKLVSAMKGGRAQKGASPAAKLHVTWAPEVYNPRATSVSHRIKRIWLPLLKFDNKENQKTKHRGSFFGVGRPERKVADESSIRTASDPQDTRREAVPYGSLLEDLDLDELMISSHGSKFKSRSPRVAFAKFHSLPPSPS